MANIQSTQSPHEDNTTIRVHAYPCGIGAGNPGCGDGPAAIRDMDVLAQLDKTCGQFVWQPWPKLNSHDDNYEVIAHLNQQLGTQTIDCVKSHDLFFNVGGDQSMSVGTWAGAQAGLGANAELGLIWVDAHLDGHTPDTSETGNIHGMPLAALLGHGDERLTRLMHDLPKLKPEHVCVIGARSYERGEQELLTRLGVRIFYMEEILERGLAPVLDEAFAIATSAADAYGLCFDMDGLDPKDAPGVGTPVENGIRLNEWLQLIPAHLQAATTRFVGLEVVEYNPHLDVDHKTRDSLAAVVNNVFSNIK